MCVFLTVLIIGPVLYLVHRSSVYYKYHDLVNDKGLFRLSNCAWYGFGAIVQQGKFQNNKFIKTIIEINIIIYVFYKLIR